jgi:hypothetical protein
VDGFRSGGSSGTTLQAREPLGERAVAKGPLGAGAETGTFSGGLVQGSEAFGRRARSRKALGPEGSWSGGVSASLVQEGKPSGGPSTVRASSGGRAGGQRPSGNWTRGWTVLGSDSQVGTPSGGTA